MADLFWSIATSYLALSIIAVLLVVSWLVGHVPFGKYAPVIGPYVVLAQFVAYPTLALLAFLIGMRIADERADLKQAKIDLAFSQLQLSTQKKTAETAQKLRAEAEAKADQANQRVSEYEERLAKQPANDGCNLDDGDVRSLHDIAR
jgi:hypothetical protein